MSELPENKHGLFLIYGFDDTADLLKACIQRGWGILDTYNAEIIQAIDINEARLKGAFK